MEVRHLVRAFLLLFGGIAAEAVAAHPDPVSGDFVLRDFQFASGDRMPELRIHYRTLGTPTRDAAGVVRNAVLILHGTTGSGKQFLVDPFAGVLFGPGQPLDARRDYLALPDGIGHGESSKPSDGLRARFPRYGYDDMVAAQYRLLSEGLKVNHLRLVLGTSMGGMHAWVWAEKYPAFMDGVVSLACLPAQISGRNRAWRKMIIDEIRGDPEWKQGEYAAQPRGLTSAVRFLLLMSSSPLQWLESAPTRDAADHLLEEQLRARIAGADANDFLYAFEASRDYDPSASLERIEKPVLAINSADDLINPPELGVMERLMPRVRRGRFVLLPISDQTRGHGTHTRAAVWRDHLEGFLAQLPD